MPTGAEKPAEETVFKVWAVGETDARLDVVLVGTELVVETAGGFLRGRDVLVTQPEVDCEIGADAPVVFSVEVGLVDPVLKEKRPVAFLEVVDAAIQE